MKNSNETFEESIPKKQERGWHLVVPDPSVDIVRQPDATRYIPAVAVEELIPGIKPRATVSRSSHFSEDVARANTPRSEIFIGKLEVPELLEFLEPFRDQIVVDLGAGTYAYDYYIVAAARAAAYIGVEPHHYDYLRPELFGYSGSYMNELGIPKIPASVINEDALSFLERLPDGSVSVLASGIDRYIITKESYIQAVNVEIARVLHPKGAFINWDSVFRLGSDAFQMETLSEKQQHAILLNQPNIFQRYLRKKKE